MFSAPVALDDDSSDLSVGVAEPESVLHRIPEAAIQDAWVHGLFDGSSLRTTEGDGVRVLSPGRLNRDSGPDVTDARLLIDGLTWAGDVEIHRTSRDWEAHGHDSDPGYNRVVLHVVLSADRKTGTLRRADGTALPELVLLPHLSQSLSSLLRRFRLDPQTTPPCGHRWSDLDPEQVRQWVRRLGVERLWARTRALGHAYGRRPDLDRLLVARVFRALGYDANADAMEELARRAPLAALRRFDGPDAHAILLGLAGLIESDDLFHGSDLANRYTELSAPLGLTPMPRESWRRGGRPANAPRTRIAQAAALLAPGSLFRSDPIPRLFCAAQSGPAAMIDLLRTRPLGDAPRLGVGRAERVIADAVLPVLLLAAEQAEDPGQEAPLLHVYGRLAPATDRVVRQFEAVGFRPGSALETQGLHRLARDYCAEGRCARCSIGTTLYPALARVG